MATGDEGAEVDQSGEAKTSADETAAATTANTSTDASAPSQPSVPPERREGQATTGNAGAGVHQPNGALTDSLRRHDGATTSVRNSAQSAGRADSTITDHRQWREDVHVEDRGGSGTGHVEGHVEVQGGEYESGQGCDDSTTNDASDESR